MLIGYQSFKQSSLLLLITGSLLSFASHAEISLSVYSGTVFTENTDVQLNQPGGGTIELEPTTHVFIFGGQWYFS